MRAKKAELADYIIFFVVVFIIILIFSLALFHAFLIKGTLKFELNEKMKDANNDLLILDILKAPVKDMTMADIIVESYLSDNYAELETEMGRLVGEYMGTKTDWQIYIDDEKKKESCGIIGCNGKKHTYETQLPLINPTRKNNIKVTLSIYS